MFGQATPVFVSTDTIYRECRTDQSALLFFKTAAPVVRTSQVMLRGPRPPAFLFEDRFVSVYPVLEFNGQNAIGGIPNAALSLFQVSYRPPEVEPEYRRVDHQVLFRIVRPYVLTLQSVGYTIDVPDFNDEPWREWVHPAPTPESLLYPFRQIPTFRRGQQYNLFFNQPPSPRLDPEADKIRPYDYGVMLIRQAQAIPVPLTTCGQIDVYDYGNGTVLVAWPPFN